MLILKANTIGAVLSTKADYGELSISQKQQIPFCNILIVALKVTLAPVFEVSQVKRQTS